MPAPIILNGPPIQQEVNATTGVRLETGGGPAVGSYLWLSASKGVTSGEVYVELATDDSLTDGAALGTGYITVPVSSMPYPLEVRGFGSICLHGDATFDVQAQLR